MITSLTLIYGLLSECLSFAKCSLLLLVHPAEVPLHETPPEPLHFHRHPFLLHQILALVTAVSGIRQLASCKTWNGVTAGPWRSGWEGDDSGDKAIWKGLVVIIIISIEFYRKYNLITVS